MSNRCRAKNPAECRVHGTPFSSSYDSWVKSHENLEPAVVFKKLTAPFQPANRTLVLGGQAVSNFYSFYFAGDADTKKFGSPDATVDINGMKEQDIKDELAAKLATAVSVEADEIHIQRLRNIQAELDTNGLTGIRKKSKALYEAWNNEEVESWYLDASTVHKIHLYGQAVDARKDLDQEEKAIVLTQSIIKHEKFESAPYPSQEFHELTKTAWTIYKNYDSKIKGL